MRAWNCACSTLTRRPGGRSIKLGDWPGATPTHAQPVNFEGQPVGRPIPFADGRLSLKLGAKKIVTLRLG